MYTPTKTTYCGLRILEKPETVFVLNNESLGDVLYIIMCEKINILHNPFGAPIIF